MNKLFPALLVVITYSLFSCNSGSSGQIPDVNAETNKVFQLDREKLTTDYTAWYNYAYYNVPLSQDFIGLDTDSTSINKSTFLHKMLEGNFVALKTRILQGTPVYKLYEVKSENKSFYNTTKQMAEIEMAHVKMEGNELPPYNFTDLNGKTYDNTNTKGKLLVVKCWFIACVACVKEFPELNELVEENKDREDVLFVSLAMDAKNDLAKFLTTKEFKYAVIPETRSFMIDGMHINMFPTHLLIDRKGKIVKVVNRIENLIPFLEKLKA